MYYLIPDSDKKAMSDVFDDIRSTFAREMMCSKEKQRSL